MPGGMLKDREVAARLGIGKSKVWVLTKDDPGFPAPYRFGKKATRWSEDELDAYIRTSKQSADAARRG